MPDERKDYDWNHATVDISPVTAPEGQPPTYYKTKVGTDGSFTFEDVPAQDYNLWVQARAQPKDGPGSLGPVLGYLRHEFTVPHIPGGHSDRPLQLGKLKLKRLKSQ